jgi:hypothetical protein
MAGDAPGLDPRRLAGEGAFVAPTVGVDSVRGRAASPTRERLLRRDPGTATAGRSGRPTSLGRPASAGGLPDRGRAGPGGDRFCAATSSRMRRRRAEGQDGARVRAIPSGLRRRHPASAGSAGRRSAATPAPGGRWFVPVAHARISIGASRSVAAPRACGRMAAGRTSRASETIVGANRRTGRASTRLPRVPGPAAPRRRACAATARPPNQTRVRGGTTRCEGANPPPARPRQGRWRGGNGRRLRP